MNHHIRVPEIRLIGSDGEQVGVIKTRDALYRAEQEGLDLVEISPNAEPPVCRIMDHGKFQFELSKRKAIAKKKQKVVQIKEIKMRPGTDVGDFNVKVKKMINFLENGDKVKVTVRFRGREMQHKEIGLEQFDKVEKALDGIAQVESRNRFEGRQITMVFAPLKDKPTKKQAEVKNAENENE